MSEKPDISIYEDVRDDIAALLKNYAKEEYLDDVSLYIVDKAAIEELKNMRRMLELEYNAYEKPSGKKGSPKRVPFSLSTLVKVVNFDEPANSYRVFISERWREINDRDKVYDNIETEFIKHKNKIKAFTKRKLKEKKVSPEMENQILRNIELEIAAAEKEKDYILENFDKLDVRISAYKERKKYAMLRWYIKKKRQKDVNLRGKVPNVLWFEDLSDDELIRSNNELVRYLKGAKRAYGDLYYAPLKEKDCDEPAR